MPIRIQAERFHIGQEIESLAGNRPDIGAAVSFTGIVRDSGDDPLESLVIEHYPGMAELAIGKIVDEARRRWTVSDYLIIHRYGILHPGEEIMMVATVSAHRADAFAAAEFMMDYLKTRAPFWKKEIRSGRADWLASSSVDKAALQRWKTGSA